MSDVATVARRHAREVDLGHPVRSFTLTMLALGLVLLALQWTGSVHPRIDVSPPGSSSSADGSQHRFGVAVRNDGVLPVKVTDATLLSTRMAQVELGLAAPGAIGVPGATATPFSPFTLDAGETRVITMSVVPECFARLVGLELDVRTPLGLTRSVEVRGSLAQDVHGGC